MNGTSPGGGIGPCPPHGRFRRILQTRDGVLGIGRGCAEGLLLPEFDGPAAAQALAHDALRPLGRLSWSWLTKELPALS